MRKLAIIFGLVMLFIITGCQNQEKKVFTNADINIIPKPQQVQLNEGSFVINKSTKIVLSNGATDSAVKSFLEQLEVVSGFKLQNVSDVPVSNYINITLGAKLGSEAYTIKVSDTNINIAANDASGVFYALETLAQLLPAEFESNTKQSLTQWEIPNVEIEDTPRFKWRGLMLDVSRHFFEKEYVLKTLDRMAMLKMNTLHLHLVDDQGWRIEIKKYPKLTEVGGFRVDHEDKPWNSRPAQKEGDKATFGGFYTQENIKDIVAYATERGITVVPEIEMPAHVTSAIAAYPEFSCLEKPVTVPSGGVWPITDIYCAGKESTFEFLEDVLTEVMALFPSKYIHVGGDEATKTNWKTCPHCKKRVKEEGLANVEELQSYFIKRMERFISSNGRVLIGWDEILEGGLAPGATVMSWRGVKGGLEASAEGHDVVMTPGSHCYFDHFQGDQDQEPQAWGGYLPLSKVYKFDPIVEGMTEDQAKHVLGGQANLWSEFVPTTAQSEYMIFPRLAALSETVWSTKESRDWDDFSARIKKMFERYDVMGINYAKSAYQVTADTKIDIEKGDLTIELKNEFPNSEIRYSLDGSDLSGSSLKYTAPFKINKSTNIKAAMFRNGEKLGPVYKKYINYHKAAGKKVTYKEMYHKSYQGAGETGMVNVLRGSKNFHDGQWQAWLPNDMELVIDLESETEISKVSVGTMEKQGSGIYFPVLVEVLLSSDGKNYNRAGLEARAFKVNGKTELKDFTIAFDKKEARYIKVKAKNLVSPPTGGGSWLFVDEIVVE